MLRKWRLIGVAIVIIGALLGVALIAWNSTHSRTWHENKQYGQWYVVYNGYGTVSGTEEEVVLEPHPAAHQDTTHAALVRTAEVFPEDVEFEVTVHTETQVRDGEPNPWEVGWVLWNYENDQRFYAVALKPNGWEISKQDPDYRGAQRFLLSGSNVTFPLNEDHRVKVHHSGDSFKVWADGHFLGEFTDEEQPYKGGSVALYTEDARVRFSDFEVLR